MKILLTLMASLLCSVYVSTLSYAGSGVQTLSPELRLLLNTEMHALQKGMQAILPAYVSGDLDEVAEIAQRIKNSYILKQQITDAHKHELKTKLPRAFLQSDQKFHQYAGQLEHVSQSKNMELVGFYYSKLSESCVSCHSQYALHRFQGLHQ